MRFNHSRFSLTRQVNVFDEGRSHIQQNAIIKIFSVAAHLLT